MNEARHLPGSLSNLSTANGIITNANGLRHSLKSFDVSVLIIQTVCR